MAVTSPIELIVATDGALLLHIPSGVLLLTLVTPFSHSVAGPAITAGSAFTTMVRVLVQPAGVVYDMNVAIAFIPVTVPVTGSIAAIRLFALAHVPPGTMFESMVDAPSHTAVGPVIGALVFTVNGITLEQPDEVNV
jgi:hypothetical protein